jgi:hypothetical protein
MENKEITMQERLEAIKDNPYAQHKAEIHKISMERGVDVGTACSMLRHEKGWEYPDGDPDITAFTAFVGELQRMTDDKNNYVLDYFEGKLD